MSRLSRRRLVLLACVVALSAALPLAAYASHALRPIELMSVDARFSVRGDTKQPEDVVVVAIDSDTFNDFNAYRQRHPAFETAWPFPRCYHAVVLDRIGAGDPAVIAVDMQFTEQTTPKCDNALVEAVSTSRPVVLATTEVDENGRTNIFGGLPLDQVGATAGHTTVIPDYGGVIRRIPYEIDGLTTFGVAAAAVAAGKPAPGAGNAMRWIDFAGGPGTIKTYSYSDVYFGKVPANAFKGKAVVIGTAAPSLQDVHLTSVSGDPAKAMAGAEVQANIVSTALRGFPLRTLPVWVNVLSILLLAAVPAVAIVWLRPLHVLLLALGVGVLFTLAAQLAFDHDRIVLFVYPLIALALSTFASMIVSYETTGSAAQA